MAVNESMVQDIVKEVMAKMQLASAPTGNHGVFQDMNEAIEAAKKSQKIVRRMSMDRSFLLSAERQEKMQRFWPAWVWTKPEWVTYRTRF